MIHLGVIGTNWISHQFVAAALETGAYDLTAVYSRETSNGTRIWFSLWGCGICN